MNAVLTFHLCIRTMQVIALCICNQLHHGSEFNKIIYIPMGSCSIIIYIAMGGFTITGSFDQANHPCPCYIYNMGT